MTIYTQHTRVYRDCCALKELEEPDSNCTEENSKSNRRARGPKCQTGFSVLCVPGLRA